MNEIRLYGTVGASYWDEESFSAKSVRDQLQGLSGPLTVRINSGGGIATEGQAIYTMLVDYPDQVHVVIDAVAASAASLVAMAGDTITMRLGSFLLIHDPSRDWLDERGTEAAHRKTADHLAVIANGYAAIYAKRAGISVEEARQVMKDETILDPDMAVAMGFATQVDPAAQAEPVARFDYRIYAHAPQSLREASEVLGAAPGRQAVMAMMAGLPRVQQKETTMGVKTPETTTGVPAVEPENIGAKASASQPVPAASPADTARAQRIGDIVSMGGFGAELALDMITRGLTLDAALAEVLTKRKEQSEMNQPKHNGHRPATIMLDARDKFVTGAALALMAKTHLKGGERNEFSSLSLTELARASIEIGGERVRLESRMDLVGRAFTMAGAHSTSDFAKILQNVQGKAALVGWEEAEETYPLFTRAGTLTDFKSSARVGLGLFSSLTKVQEGANYEFGTVGDRGETIALATYGRMIRITRQGILNDDLSILGDLPRKMGRAARRTIGDLVFAILTGNPNMADGVALFHATHGNLAASGAAPSVATLGAARAAMRVQKEAAGKPSLNIRPAYMLVPAALETTSMQLLSSLVDPTATKGMAENPVRGMAELIVDARLDDASTTAWYLAANPSMYDTIEVAYLDGVQAPYLEQQQMWTADGVEMKVRVDAGVAPLDFRTLYKNAGA